MPDREPNALEVRGLSRAFGDIVAVDGVDLVVPKGELFGLVGPDGAGKSTLIRMLSTVIAPSAGDALVLGDSIVKRPDPIKEHIGYMSQRFSLYPDLTVAENLDFYAELRGVPRGEKAGRAATLLEFAGLTGFEKRQAQFLSGGMKQKLALACTLIHRPSTILLDEPTAGVDPVSRREFWRLLYRINRSGTTIFVSTPYMDEAERATRVAFMNGGKIASIGTPAELKAGLHGEVVEVRCARYRDARRALHGTPAVRSVEMFGDTLHALVSSAADTIPDFQRRLSEIGIADAVFRTVPPSLEDAFVARLTA